MKDSKIEMMKAGKSEVIERVCPTDGRECEDGGNCLGCHRLTVDVYDSAPDHEILLGVALHGVLIAAGVLGKDSNCNGPELIAAADEYINSKGL